MSNPQRENSNYNNKHSKNSNEQRKIHKKRKNTGRKVLVGILIALLVIICGGIFYTYNLLSKTQHVSLDNSKLGLSNDLNVDSSDYVNIALFGVDDRHQLAGHADSEMIFTIDKAHKELKLTSIMRDSYVNVEGHGKTKITEAYFYGGPELALNTINTNFDLNVDKFITVGLQTLPHVINALFPNGMEVNITPGDLKYINEYIRGENRINNTNVPQLTHTGDQMLNGTQATALSRIRYSGGDQERTARQRLVLSKVYAKFKTMSPTEIPTVLEQILPYVKTNLTPSEFIKYGTDVLSMGVPNLIEARYPTNQYGHGAMINGIYYQWFDKSATIKEMHNFMYGDPTQNQSQTTTEI